MELEKLKQIIEAALMVAAAPISFDRLNQLFTDDGKDRPTRENIRTALEELENDYHGCGIELVEVGSGFRFQARAEVAPWINRLWEERNPRYSRALLETIAIVAYRQPITRGEIENIRGVAVSTNIVRTLIERQWVRIVGHRDVPGKPAVYATTKQFLDYFNLASLAELPSLAELKDIDGLNADLFAEQQPGTETETETELRAASDEDRPEHEPALSEVGGENGMDES
jgi:segregation and condensation protein B